MTTAIAPIRAILLAVCIAVLVLAGCGDDADDDTDAGGDTTGDDSSGTQLAGDDGAFAVATLDITVEHPERETVTYQLQCLGDTADLTGDADVDADAACRALLDDETVAWLVDGPDPDAICTEIYGGDDTATITGTVDDTEIDAAVDRVNGCAIAAWDELLGDVLPIPAEE